MNTLLHTMVGASRLDAQTYERVEADHGVTAAAVGVVIVASIAAAIGTGARDTASVIAGTAVMLMTWVVWIALTYIIGTRVLPSPETHSDFGEILRTTGFSASPGVLRILGVIPVIGFPILIVVTFWMLFTFVVAIRQALDYQTSARALAVCVLGWLIHGVLFFAFASVAI